MSEGAPRGAIVPTDPVGRALEFVARACAIFGGLVLTFAMLATVVSIAGRVLVNVVGGLPGFGWVGPIPGDYEIVEIGAAVAVGAFLPICQMRGGHVLVDLLFSGAPPSTLAIFSILGNFLFAVVGGIIAWRLYLGALAKFQYQESSMILGMQIGWGYLALAVFFAVATICAIYLVVRELPVLVRARA
jgi:hypothetical protein